MAWIIGAGIGAHAICVQNHAVLQRIAARGWPEAVPCSGLDVVCGTEQRSAPFMPLTLYWEEYPTFIASYTTWMYMPRMWLRGRVGRSLRKHWATICPQEHSHPSPAAHNSYKPLPTLTGRQHMRATSQHNS